MRFSWSPEETTPPRTTGRRRRARGPRYSVPLVQENLEDIEGEDEQTCSAGALAVQQGSIATVRETAQSLQEEEAWKASAGAWPEWRRQVESRGGHRPATGELLGAAGGSSRLLELRAEVAELRAGAEQDGEDRGSLSVKVKQLKAKLQKLLEENRALTLTVEERRRWELEHKAPLPCRTLR